MSEYTPRSRYTIIVCVHIYRPTSTIRLQYSMLRRHFDLFDLSILSLMAYFLKTTLVTYHFYMLIRQHVLHCLYTKNFIKIYCL